MGLTRALSDKLMVRFAKITCLDIKSIDFGGIGYLYYLKVQPFSIICNEYALIIGLCVILVKILFFRGVL